MAAIRWRQDAHLFAIRIIAFGLGLFGHQARRHLRPGWPTRHANRRGRFLTSPAHRLLCRQWTLPARRDRLTHLVSWMLPGVLGAPLIWLALRRFHVAELARAGRTD